MLARAGQASHLRMILSPDPVAWGPGEQPEDGSASEGEGRAGAFRDPPKAGAGARAPAWRKPGSAKRKKKKRKRGAAEGEQTP